jgi:DNA-binding XRE family transcriptional regulator
MDGQMKINGNTVRVLREEKSWSQEHLANASGLSGRTIQRVEAEGVGSAETRLALAAALGVPVSALMAGSSSPAREGAGSWRVPVWGRVGWGIGAIGAACLTGLIVYSYIAGTLPLQQLLVSLVPWLAFLGICAGAIATIGSWRRWRAATAQAPSS